MISQEKIEWMLTRLLNVVLMLINYVLFEGKIGSILGGIYHKLAYCILSQTTLLLMLRKNI